TGPLQGHSQCSPIPTACSWVRGGFAKAAIVPQRGVMQPRPVGQLPSPSAREFLIQARRGNDSQSLPPLRTSATTPRLRPSCPPFRPLQGPRRCPPVTTPQLIGPRT